MKIRIGSTDFDARMHQMQGDRLEIYADMAGITLDALLAAVPAGSEPEVRLLGEDGLTTALYAGRKVMEIGLVDGGETGKIVLMVEPLEQTEADKLRERQAVQDAAIAQHAEALRKQAETAEQQGATLAAAKAAARVAVASAADALDTSEIDAVRPLFDAWAAGRAYRADRDIVRHGEGGLLYICRQAHTSQASWEPGAAGTESLWACIDKVHAGTADDPIPYAGNMALVEGKHYTQGGVVYRCTRSTGMPVVQALAELVGVYVEIVEV